MIPFNLIPERSEATPGLWNRPFSALSASIASIEGGTSVLTIHASGLSVNGVVQVYANSNVTDYISFTDTSASRSNYLLGSHTPTVGDGLSLYDQSGATTIVTFSKQSTHFYGPIFAPVFDAGGASFNVKSFGAMGDGVTDDTAAFRLAISAASAIGGGVVVVPSSRSAYMISSTLTLIPNLTIAGGGGFNPSIYFSGGSGTLFSFLGTAEAQLFSSKLQNLTLFNTTSNTGIAIRIRNFQNFYVDSVVVSSWSLGVWTDWGIGTHINSSTLVLCNRALMLGGVGLAGGIRSVNSAFMDTTTVTDSGFAQNKYDIVHHGSYAAEGVLDVQGCTFFESGSAPVSGKTEYVHLSNLKNTYISGCWFESPNANRGIIVLTNVDSDGTTFPLLGCRGGFIAANDFLATGNTQNGILLEHVGGVTVMGNNFEFASGAGNPINITEIITANQVIANNYLTWSDSTAITNTIASLSSIHLILEPSHRTSSIGTLLLTGRLSARTGSTTIPAIQFGSDVTVGFYMPAAGTLNWNGTGFGINKTSGLAGTLDVNGTGNFSNNVDVAGYMKATGTVWGSSLSIGGTGTQIPAISSTSSQVAPFVVQGSASSFTVITWAAVKAGDIILMTPGTSTTVSSVSSGLVFQSHCTQNGQIEFRLSNVSTLALNQSQRTWFFTRISPF